MLRYKSEGVLNMDMGTSEYKRFTELANDASSVSQFLDTFPPPKMPSGGVDAMVKAVVRGEWRKALPKVSKADAKEIPDAVLQMERDSEKDGFGSGSVPNISTVFVASAIYCATLRTESP